jgi:hypothetical protein
LRTDLAARPNRVLGIGTNIAADEVQGYYIDFRSKTESPAWPPPWFPWPGYHRFMAVAQWGLGAYERYLMGEGQEWLGAAVHAGEFLVSEQEGQGSLAGGWFEPHDSHTFHLRGPWLSAMTQGQCASLLVRLCRETKSKRFAEAALQALTPMGVPTTEGGVRTVLAGGPFLEEYPTAPPSFVLNGAIFALWGYFDVGRGLDDDEARAESVVLTDTLARNLHRWDTGYWSRYDLYPHPTRNVASLFYHVLHTNQLRAMTKVSPEAEFAETASRFERYAGSRVNRARALAEKAVFRLLVPRRSRWPTLTRLRRR